jgi:hypothetical protein
MAPLASHEVRWFFEGGVDQHLPLQQWFETTVPRPDGLPRPEWKGRLGDEPDIYLLIPGSTDLGIKWREGELQIKGRVAALGAQLFAGRHQGAVERWIKWSYRDLPDAWRRLFATPAENGLIAVPVRKIRALRKLRLDLFTGTANEVAPDTLIDRGMALELTDLELNGSRYCSLAFEAFPDDSGMHLAFARTVSRFLHTLRDTELEADQSLSYPAWLERVQ